MSEPTDAPTLTPAERKALKARAHHLNPVVMIGDSGLTEAVLAESARALAAHELVKIRVLGDDRAHRHRLMGELCEALRCAPVQMIGKLLVVYRPRGSEDDRAGSAKARRPKAPHRPKKAAGARLERAESGAARASKASKPSGISKPSKPATGSKGPRRTAAADGAAQGASRGRSAGGQAAARTGFSDRTAGKRTDRHAGDQPPARRSRPSPASTGPARLQGKPGPRTGGARKRAKGGR